MLIATGKIVAPTTKKAPAGKSGQSSRYPLPDSVFAENGLNFDDDALMEQVDVCDFLFEVNLQLPFVTTLNLAHALPADPELISWQSFWSYQEYCFSDPASSSAIRPDGSSNSAVSIYILLTPLIAFEKQGAEILAPSKSYHFQDNTQRLGRRGIEYLSST